MRVVPTRLDGPLLLEPSVHGDERGFFIESWRADRNEKLGISGEAFVQDNHSRSRRGVLRGMHFQIGDGIGKLVRCGRGAIFDVIVDIRRGSPTYADWEGFVLDDENLRELWVPVGFAHGFLTMSEVADVHYKQTGYYDAQLERGIAYDDPQIAIDWPQRMDLVTSQRDGQAPTLSDVAEELPFAYRD